MSERVQEGRTLLQDGSVSDEVDLVGDEYNDWSQVPECGGRRVMVDAGGLLSYFVEPVDGGAERAPVFHREDDDVRRDVLPSHVLYDVPLQAPQS